jgi:hypothetical protein
VQDNGEQRLVDLDFAVVFDEAELPEFVHEEIDARTGGADHIRQGLLGDFRQHALRLILFPVAGQKQQRARQALFTGVEELIDQILLDPDVMCQHVGDEMIR